MRGKEALSVQSRSWRDRFKKGDPVAIDTVKDRIAAFCGSDESVANFFGEGSVLVPVPGSAPLVPGGLWVPRMIAHALTGVGLASATHEWLKRRHAVPKSAFAPPGQRPSAKDHFESFDVLPPRLFAPERIVLVDDVVTRGATLIAAASRLAVYYPRAEIKAFALLRALSSGEIGGTMRKPTFGRIAFNGVTTTRRP